MSNGHLAILLCNAAPVSPVTGPTAVFPVTVSPVTVSPVTVSPVTVSPVTVSPVTVFPVTVSPVPVSAVTDTTAVSPVTGTTAVFCLPRGPSGGQAEGKSDEGTQLGLNTAQNLLKEFRTGSKASVGRAHVLFNLLMLHTKEEAHVQNAATAFSEMMAGKVRNALLHCHVVDTCSYSM